MTRLPIRFPLLALNASALQAESKKLAAEAGSLDAGQLAGQASRIADKTEEIRKQAQERWTRRTVSSTCCVIRSRPEGATGAVR